MMWRIAAIDQAFIAAWQDAGDPDQAVIDAYLAKRRKPLPAQKHTGIKRWYYLYNDNPRIRLTCVGRPLEDFGGQAAKVLVGTVEIIGEFDGNRAFAGQRGLALNMQSIEWLQGQADQRFATGSEALAAIDESVLDQPGPRGRRGDRQEHGKRNIE